jgi:hypothetical protein
VMERPPHLRGHILGHSKSQCVAAAHALADPPVAGTLGLEALDYGRRMALERELGAATTAQIKAFMTPPPAGSDAGAAATPVPGGYRLPPSNAIFDESGHFVVFPTMMGIKIVNTVTDKVNVHLGLVENTERFLSISLFQGVPKASSQYNIAKTGSAVPVMSEAKDEGEHRMGGPWG